MAFELQFEKKITRLSLDGVLDVQVLKVNELRESFTFIHSVNTSRKDILEWYLCTSHKRTTSLLYSTNVYFGKCLPGGPATGGDSTAHSVLFGTID